MRYSNEDRTRVYQTMDTLREQMAYHAVMACYALNGDAVLRAHDHAEDYFTLLEQWKELGRQLDAALDDAAGS